MKIFILTLSLFFSASTFACQARPGQYSYDKSILAAHSIVTAIVLKQEHLGERKYRMEFEVTKTWKGKTPATFTAETTDNMCEPFGEYAPVEAECVVFLTAKNEIIKSPASSYCIAKSARKLRNIETEFGKVFKEITERRK